MLKIYICPKCFNFRLVSRKPDAICFHCGMILEQCSLDYGTYMNMTEEERNEYRENYKKRMINYHDRIHNLYHEQIKENSCDDIKSDNHNDI